MGSRTRGEILELPDAEQAELFLLIHRRLGARGYEGYEVSNFASSPEHRSRHWPLTTAQPSSEPSPMGCYDVGTDGWRRPPPARPSPTAWRRASTSICEGNGPETGDRPESPRQG
ncbi:MAG: hypothetical protein GY720_21665, partial [bacterium]|nr:hypothetical protein [bacterium]